MKKIVIIVFLILQFIDFINACTTVIISGEHTPDGRPVLWKHRDTDYLDNKVSFFRKGDIWAIALVDSEDKKEENIWIGYNSAGFAIMNTASYNLNNNDTVKLSDLEGVLMKAALLECRTVDEFEKFLNNLPKPMGVEANFGVIDALGNGAYFETGNYSFTKYDVNDKNVAPHGYIVRTNYSFSGIESKGGGYIRFETAENLFYRASGENNLSLEFILNRAGTSLKNALTGIDNSDLAILDENQDNFYYIEDCINRYYSSSSVIIQGVKQNENPELTCMWLKLGFPLTTILTPVFGNNDGILPTVITAEEGVNASLCDKALLLKQEAIPMYRGHCKNYVNSTKLINAQQTGIMQLLQNVNDEVYHTVMQKLILWRKENKIPINQLKDYYNWLDNYVNSKYSDLFQI